MDWEQLWLRYDKKNNLEDKKYFSTVFFEKKGTIVSNAVEELNLAAMGMFGVQITMVDVRENATIVISINEKQSIKSEEFILEEKNGVIIITASAEVGILYGVFEFIKQVACDNKIQDMYIRSVPDKEFRMLNHWDNADGTIERGYSGKSFFFKDGQIIINQRTKDYIRLIASIGINGVVINNVNVVKEATEFITEKYFDKIAELEKLFRGYGIKLYLSLNYAACMEIGGLHSADPLDSEVIAWWKDRMKLVYSHIPTLGGFLVKADSEGRPGPFTYGRNQAAGANMLAKAIEPYDGIIIWRCFVYNCQQDWRDKMTDRARAAYDYFQALDGEFAKNVILQIKNGPMDFQVREPIMPLFGKLKKTKYMMEVQIAQEYTGQQIDLCYLMPWFKEILDTHTGCDHVSDTVGELLQSSMNGGMGCGIVAVTNTGNDCNWTGNDLAAANLYGFGKIAWNTQSDPKRISEEWIRQTFGNEDQIIETITKLLIMSWPVYEKYTAPLGVGFMVTPQYHYGPNIDGYEYSRWGTYHRADHLGIGVDRSENGTGYALLYEPILSELYNNVEKCPDNLLLFFHHVPYTHRLKNGKTVIQHIYDTHFEGKEDVYKMLELWRSLENKIDAKRFARIDARFCAQKENAKEWCDQINSYFYRKSAIGDAKNRIIY